MPRIMRDENPDQVVNSKGVNGAIPAQIRPLLKEHGFVKFTSRTSWRFTEQTIHVLNFQSFNSYLAEGVGSTTYSFAINLGCYIKAIPSRLGCFKQENGYLMPPEYACHLRKQLLKSIEEPELERKDIWYIDPEGRYLDQAVLDAKQTIMRDGLPWFEKFTDLQNIYDLLLGEEHYVDGTWGFGVKGSPARNYLTGYVALAVGDYGTAALALQLALESDCYDNDKKQIEDLIRGLKPKE